MTYRNLPIQPQPIGLAQVVIARDADTGEYRCRLILNRIPQPNADYFTDDKDDARHTAYAMMRHASVNG